PARRSQWARAGPATPAPLMAIRIRHLRNRAAVETGEDWAGMGGWLAGLQNAAPFAEPFRSLLISDHVVVIVIFVGFIMTRPCHVGERRRMSVIVRYAGIFGLKRSTV